MFKKIINKIIMATQCYLALKERFSGLEFVVDAQAEKIKEQDVLIAKNKTTARKIVRTVNGLIKREDSINATKKIKALCNEIIKGE
jgi:hypothetical protein